MARADGGHVEEVYDLITDITHTKNGDVTSDPKRNGDVVKVRRMA